MISHTADKIIYPGNEFSINAYYKNPDNTISEQSQTYWEEIFTIKLYPYLRYEFTNFVEFDVDNDYEEGQIITFDESQDVFMCLKTYDHTNYTFPEEFTGYATNQELKQEQLWGRIGKKTNNSGLFLFFNISVIQ